MTSDDPVLAFHHTFLHMAFLYVDLRNAIRWENGPRIVTHRMQKLRYRECTSTHQSVCGFYLTRSYMCCMRKSNFPIGRSQQPPTEETLQHQVGAGDTGKMRTLNLCKKSMWQILITRLQTLINNTFSFSLTSFTDCLLSKSLRYMDVQV